MLNMPALTPIQELAAGKVQDFTGMVGVSFGLGCLRRWQDGGGLPRPREALLAGRRVLYAVPRQDVVREMGQRFARAFGIKINVLHGGEGRIETPDAPLTVATTHQVLRFIAHFDLAVWMKPMPTLTKAAGCSTLDYASGPAHRPDCHDDSLPMLNSDKRLRREASVCQDSRPPSRSPACACIDGRRASCGAMAGRRKPSTGGAATLVDWAERMLPVLIFLPTVGAVESFGRFLQQVPELKPIPLDWVHAGHPHRDRIVEEFRSGKLRMMVTTTVLERGLNFPGVQVMVLHADDERVFDTECLVQIAGRVGRYASHPGGEVVFIGCKISRAMLEAEKWIREMNKEAKQAGLLDDFTSF